jgi:membrane protease YdiL (CAAX protease family)
MTAVTGAGAARMRTALAVCVFVLAVTALLVDTVVPAWAYPLVNTVVAAIVIAVGMAGGATAAAIGLSIGRRTVRAALLGLGLVAAVLAVAWALPYFRSVFTVSPAANITLGGLAWAVLVRVPFGTVLLEEVAFRGVLPVLLGGDGQRWKWWPVLGSSALFGLFHLFTALRLGRCDGLAVHSLFCPAGPVLGPAAIMLMAMGLGVALSLVRHLGGGLLAPFAVHTAANSAGYLLAWISAL